MPQSVTIPQDGPFEDDSSLFDEEGFPQLPMSDLAKQLRNITSSPKTSQRPKKENRVTKARTHFRRPPNAHRTTPPQTNNLSNWIVRNSLPPGTANPPRPSVENKDSSSVSLDYPLARSLHIQELQALTRGRDDTR